MINEEYTAEFDPLVKIKVTSDLLWAINDSETKLAEFKKKKPDVDTGLQEHKTLVLNESYDFFQKVWERLLTKNSRNSFLEQRNMELVAQDGKLRKMNTGLILEVENLKKNIGGNI